MNKVKYEIDDDGQFVATNKAGEMWLDQMYDLIDDVRNPMVEQKFLNMEASQDYLKKFHLMKIPFLQ